MRIDKIERSDTLLRCHFAHKIVVQRALTRSMVSFQANKSRPSYRWYKFKEGFSATLIEYLLHAYAIQKGAMLDPFAGSGSALFAASAEGLRADGIELLPIGQQIIATRKLLESKCGPNYLNRARQWAMSKVWQQFQADTTLKELRITKNAYPPQTKDAIERYLAACRKEEDSVQTIAQFALLCVLESVSFTRKDGQYLRWDWRSGRAQRGKMFDKGVVLDFDRAICEKIEQIVADRASMNEGLFPIMQSRGEIRLFAGSCLDILPQLADGAYDAIITSPPYCNRYDYTRTYALELALLGVDEQGLLDLRQRMLSCTVENRDKDLLAMNCGWKRAVNHADNQPLLQEILEYLFGQKKNGDLNNGGIPRMVKGYFYEMACVVMECARVLKSGAPMLMINDNVRYAGVSISVDMILSALAEELGFQVENILVLPNGKGNSSQQMGAHGREELRKCVYVWRKR